MIKMLVFGGLVMLIVLTMNGAFCAHLTDEFSVGTNLNKYLWAPKEGEDGMEKRDGEKRTTELWFGPRLGKRSQQIEMENLPEEILEILEKVRKSPELQSILAEKLQLGGKPYVIYIPNAKSHDSHLIMSRPLRDSSDMANLNSRPYPPRFGRSLNFGELPPYLPRLGRSSN